MRELPFAEESFDLVVNLFTSFGYFDDDSEHVQVLSCVSEAMKHGGTLVIDYLNAGQVRRELVPYDERVENGITMAGGSSQLRGLTSVISNASGLDVKLAEDPLTCVARGTSVYLENLELWKDTMESDSDEI
jgi:actin-like ATPase involved in cell morphogenesis